MTNEMDNVFATLLSKAIDWLNDPFRWFKIAYWIFLFKHRNNVELRRLVKNSKVARRYLKSRNRCSCHRCE